MKTMKIFLSMAALALVGAMMTGCSSDDNFAVEQQPENKSNVVTVTTTVSLDGGAQTRALTSAGVKTFAVGEQVALRYWNTSTDLVKAVSSPLTASDISADGKTATLTFTLTNPDAIMTGINYCYPAAMAGEDGGPDYTKLATQDGTLATLSSTLDLATGSGKLSGTNLPANVTLSNQLAILAITLKNSDGSSDITSSITGMNISAGTRNYAVSRSAAAGPIYVAIRPTNSAAIEIIATDGSKNYTKSLTGKTYAKGNGYSVSWRMAEPAIGHALSSAAVGDIICTDVLAYAGSDYNNLPTGVTALAKVCYVSGDGHGLALALADEGENYWIAAKYACEGKGPASWYWTWKLPSQSEWNNMISAAGGYAALRDGFTSVGGTNMQSNYYWSSTEDGDNAWICNFQNNDGGSSSLKANNHYVRAVLAF